MGTVTPERIVDTLLGGQDAGEFMATFNDPYKPMRKLFGNPSEDVFYDHFDKTFSDPKRRSKFKLRVFVMHQKPVAHGARGQHKLDERTNVQFDIIRPDGNHGGHSDSAREGLEGFGVFTRLPVFIERLRKNWPATEEELRNEVKLFLRSIGKVGYWDDVTPSKIIK